MTKTNKQLAQFLSQTARYLNNGYGLQIRDIDENDALCAFEDGETPLQFVKRLAEKYGLERISHSPFQGGY